VGERVGRDVWLRGGFRRGFEERRRGREGVRGKRRLRVEVGVVCGLVRKPLLGLLQGKDICRRSSKLRTQV